MHHLDRRRNLALQLSQEPFTPSPGIRAAQPKLTMDQFVRFKDKTIPRLKGVNPIVALGRPLFLVSVTLLHLGIHIPCPMHYLRMPLIAPPLDLSLGTSHLQPMTQRRPTTRIFRRRGIWNLPGANSPLNRPIFPKGLQILQIIAPNKGIGTLTAKVKICSDSEYPDSPFLPSPAHLELGVSPRPQPSHKTPTTPFEGSTLHPSLQVEPCGSNRSSEVPLSKVLGKFKCHFFLKMASAANMPFSS